MGAILQNALESLRKFWTGMTRGEKIRLVAIAGGIIVLSIVVVLILSRTTYAVIYNGSAEEAGTIAEQLRAQGENVRTQGDGTVLVPEERLSDLRMSLAASGYQTASFSTDYLDKAMGLGVTDADKRVFQTMQKAEEIRTVLKQRFSAVADCLVLLNIPETSRYSISPRDDKESSASVTIEPATGRVFTQDDADAVRAVVSAGTGIAEQQIVVVDSNSRQYPYREPGTKDDESEGMDVLAERLELKREWEDLLRVQIEQLLAPVFGSHVKAQASVVLNFDRTVSESIEFTPSVDDSGIVLSMERLFEASRTDEYAEGVPGTDTNGMGTVEYPIEDLQDGEAYRKYMETYNYEVNRLTTQTEHEAGAVTRLSLGVVVDNEIIAEEYSDTLIDLVANAIGISDRSLVSVAFMPFNAANAFQDDITKMDDTMREIQTRQLVRTGIICGLILILVVVGLLFARWILRSRSEERRASELIAAGITPGGTVDYLADGELGELGGLDESEPEEPELGVAQKSEGLIQLEKFIDTNPDAVAQLLRNWISDE